MYFINVIREMAKSRKYTPWEPPTGKEKRDGKKILKEKEYPTGN